MIDPTPAWTFDARRPLTQWYGHVALLPDRVLGQWCCVDRATGRPLWERSHRRANNVVGCNAGVIVADEMRSDGPWTASFGCYGLSLETGDLLWASHGAGLWGGVLRALDFLPGFTNDLRDKPLHVASGECLCASGRVLDVRTGRLLRRLAKEEVREIGRRTSEAGSKSDARRLYHDTRLHFGDGSQLAVVKDAPASATGSSGLGLRMLDAHGEPVWTFAVAATGYAMSDVNFYAYRYAPPYVYFIVSEQPSRVRDPCRPQYVLPNPTCFHLLAVDLKDGSVAQDVRLNVGAPAAECRIEDVDERAVAVSLGQKRLQYYRRV